VVIVLWISKAPQENAPDNPQSKAVANHHSRDVAKAPIRPTDPPSRLDSFARQDKRQPLSTPNTSAKSLESTARHKAPFLPPRRPSPPPGVVSSSGPSQARRSSGSSSGHLKIYKGTFQRPRRLATQSPIKRANNKRGPIDPVFQAATSLQQLLRKDKKLGNWKSSGLQIDALIKLTYSENQNKPAQYKTIKETEDLLNSRALWSAEQLNYMKQKPFVDLKRAVQHYLNVIGR
jgi:hypothetical protein